MVGRIEYYGKKGIHYISEFIKKLAISAQEESNLDEGMYREMECKYDFNYRNSVSTIASIASKNIQDYINLTAFRRNDFKVEILIYHF